MVATFRFVRKEIPMSAKLVHHGAAVLTLMIAASGIGHAQNMVSGTVSINNDKFDMKYAAAALVPDSFDKTKLQARIVFADQPVPQDLVADEAQVWDLKSKGHHGLEIQIALDKSNYSVFVISRTIQGSVSRSGTFDGKQLSVFTDKRVEGAMQLAP